MPAVVKTFSAITMKIKYASRICTSSTQLICFIGVYRCVPNLVTQILPILIFKEFIKYLKTAYFEITKAAASLDLSGTDKYT